MAKATLSVEQVGDQLSITADLDVNKECKDGDEWTIEQIIIAEIHKALSNDKSATILGDFLFQLNQAGDAELQEASNEAQQSV